MQLQRGLFAVVLVATSLWFRPVSAAYQADFSIFGSLHNVGKTYTSSGSWAPQGVCSPCHVPHMAKAARLFPGRMMAAESANSKIGVIGRICLTCHNGQTDFYAEDADGAQASEPITVPNMYDIVISGMLGKDEIDAGAFWKSTSHPLKTYWSGLEANPANIKTGYFPASGKLIDNSTTNNLPHNNPSGEPIEIPRPVEATEVWRASSIWTYAGRFWPSGDIVSPTERFEVMECTTCHNPHRQNGYRPQMVDDTDPSGYYRRKDSNGAVSGDEWRRGNFLGALLYDPMRGEPNNPERFASDTDYNDKIYPEPNSDANDDANFYKNPNKDSTEKDLPQNFCSYCHVKRERSQVEVDGEVLFNHPVGKVMGRDVANYGDGENAAIESLRYASLQQLNNTYTKETPDSNLVYRIFNSPEAVAVGPSQGLRFDFEFDSETGRTNIVMNVPYDWPDEGLVYDRGNSIAFTNTMDNTFDTTADGDSDGYFFNKSGFVYLGGRLANFVSDGYPDSPTTDRAEGIGSFEPYGGREGGVICNTCHKAHSAGFGGKLTVVDYGRDENGDPLDAQLCMLCHLKKPIYKQNGLFDANKCEDIVAVGSDDNPTSEAYPCLNDPVSNVNLVQHTHPVGDETCAENGLYRSSNSNRVLNVKIPYSWPVFTTDSPACSNKIMCTTCHDPHLAPGKPILRKQKQRFCVECHGMKTTDINQAGNPIFYSKPGMSAGDPTSGTVGDALANTDEAILTGGGPASHPVYVYANNLSAEATGIGPTGRNYLYGPDNARLRVQDDSSVNWPNECELPIYDTTGVELADSHSDEGFILCTTCHHVHAGYGPALVRAPGAGMSALCVSCHTRMKTLSGDFCNMELKADAYGANPSEFIIEYSLDSVLDVGYEQVFYNDGTQAGSGLEVDEENPLVSAGGLPRAIALDPVAAGSAQELKYVAATGQKEVDLTSRLGTHPTNKIIYNFNYKDQGAAGYFTGVADGDIQKIKEEFGQFDYTEFSSVALRRPTSAVNRPAEINPAEELIGNWNYLIQPELTTYASNRRSLFGTVKVGDNNYQMLICQSCHTPHGAAEGLVELNFGADDDYHDPTPNSALLLHSNVDSMFCISCHHNQTEDQTSIFKIEHPLSVSAVIDPTRKPPVITDENGMVLSNDTYLGSVIGFDTTGVAGVAHWLLAHWDGVSNQKMMAKDSNDVTYEKVILAENSDDEKYLYVIDIRAKRNQIDRIIGAGAGAPPAALVNKVIPWYPANYPQPYSGLDGAASLASEVVIYSYLEGYQVDIGASTPNSVPPHNYAFVSGDSEQRLVCDSCHAPHAASTEMGTLGFEHAFTFKTMGSVPSTPGDIRTKMLDISSQMFIHSTGQGSVYLDYESNHDTAVKLGAARIHPVRDYSSKVTYGGDGEPNGITGTIKGYSGLCRNCHIN